MTNTEEINKIPDQRIIDLADAILPALESGTYTIKEKAVEIAIFVLQAGYLPSSALVRPLVWEEPAVKSKYFDYYAETPIGFIYIKKRDGVWEAWFRNHFRFIEIESLEQAKSIVQSHYQSLIASCLQGGGYTEEQIREAIRQAFDKAEYGIFNSARDSAMNEILTALKQQ